MANNTVDLEALGQAVDTTWGRSSTPQTAQHSVKFTITGERLNVAYVAMVNCGTQHELIRMRRLYSDESESIIAAALKSVKATYKELAGSALTTKEVASDDSLELVGASPHNPRRTALYRRTTSYTIG